MNISDWSDTMLEGFTFSTLSAEIMKTSVLEWVAVIAGVMQVLLAWKNNVLLYPAGIISTTISIWLLAHVTLYAESALNVYYLVMSIYGWWLWIRRKNEPALPVSKCSKNDWFITLSIVIIGWLVLWAILKKFTPSDVPVMDAFVSATAWAGMWLLAKRKIENWILLNISNLFAIPLQFYKHIYLYGLLTLVLFLVAIFGYFEWRKIYRQQHSLKFEL